MGGRVRFTPLGVNLKICTCTGISLYFLISWHFRMGSHWQQWTVHSVLWQFQWGVRFTPPRGKSENLHLHWYFLIFPYKLTVSNGLSLVTVNSSLSPLAVLIGGGSDLPPPGGKSENLSSRTFRCAHQKGLFASRNTNYAWKNRRYNLYKCRLLILF